MLNNIPSLTFFINKGALDYLGTPMHGLVNDFDITNTGLLAASHREGAGAVNNYLNNLVKIKMDDTISITMG